MSTITRANLIDTCDTNHADALLSITSRREALARQATNGATVSELVAELNAVANLVGVARTWARLASVARHGLTADTATSIVVAAMREEVTDALIAGADDTWSGRANDARRAEFEGVRNAARHALRMLDNVVID